jgi:outer membrane phospholipase A
VKFIYFIFLFHLTTAYAINDDGKDQLTPKGESKGTSEDSSQMESDKITKYFHPYHRNYFVVGPDAKFQISFKWNIFNNPNFYFGYTQLALWDIFGESEPFKDITFSPEVFYRFNLNILNYSKIDLGLFQHSSNGREGTYSRSFNQSYIRIISEKEFSDGFSFIMENKFSIFYKIEEFSQDIDDFLGFYQLSLRLKNIFKFAFDDEELYVRYRPGKKLFVHSDRDYGSLNLGFSFRFQKSRMLPTFYLDYYTGYTETILDYRKKSNNFRAGIATTW